jgi:hypothetical protein
MALQSEMVAGEWDVYCNGVHSVVNLMQNGAFTHMLWGGVQGYWGHWSLQEAPQGPVLHFDLAGAHPETFFGPNGPQSMQWPSQENWLVTGMLGNQITTTDAILIRRVPMPFASPGFPSPMQTFQPGQFAAPPFTGMPGAMGQFPSPQFAMPPTPTAYPVAPQAPHGQPAQPPPAVMQSASVEMQPVSNDAVDGPQPPPAGAGQDSAVEMQPISNDDADAPVILPSQAPQPSAAQKLAAAQQAKKDFDTAQQINSIYSGIMVESAKATASISDQWAAFNNDRNADFQKQYLATITQTHTSAQNFIDWLRK